MSANDDTIHRTRYEPLTLDAIIALGLYTVFSMNVSLVEEMLVVWWMKRRLKKEVTRRKQPTGFTSYYNKSGKLDSFFCSQRSDRKDEGFNIVIQGNTGKFQILSFTE